MRRSPVFVVLPLALAALAPAGADAAAKRADLAPAKPTEPPAQVAAGAKLAIGAEVRNRGTAKAKASSLGAFLSTDAKRSAKDVALPRLAVKALKKGKQLEVGGKVVVPPATKPGTYRLIVCADVLAKVREGAREDNNCVVAKKKLRVVPGGGSASDGNGPPTPGTLKALATEDTPLTVRIDLTDPDTCDVDVAIVAAPAHGTVSPVAPLPCTPGATNADAATFTYTPAANYAGPDTLQYALSDGTNPAQTATLAIDVAAVNDAPTASIGGPASATQDTQVPLSVAVGDVEDGDALTTVRADRGYLGFGDSYCTKLDEGNGQSDLNKRVVYRFTPAQATKCLQQLRYRPSATDAAPDTVTVEVRDAGGAVASASTSIGVVEVNDAPELIGDAFGYAVEEGFYNPTPSSFEGTQYGFDYGVRDLDAGASPIQVTIEATGGTASLKGDSSALTFVEGDGDLDTKTVVRGTVGQLDAALRDLEFRGGKDVVSGAGLTLTADDLGGSGPGGAKTDTLKTDITIGATNDAVDVDWTAGPGLNLAEDEVLTFTGARKITVADPDAAKVRVTFATTSGVLDLATVDGLSFTEGDGVDDATMTFRGAPAAVTAALEGATLTPPADQTTYTQVSLSAADEGASGTGGPTSDTMGVSVAYAAVNDAPVVSKPADFAAPLNTQHVLTGSKQFSVSDVDAGSAPLPVFFSTNRGTLTLATTAGLTLVGGNGTGTVSFKGPASAVNAALDGAVFSRGAVMGAGSITLTVNDQGSTGSGGAQEAVGSTVVTTG